MNTHISAATPTRGSGWSTIWGVVLVICGILAISVPIATSLALVLILGWLILGAAVAHLIFAFQAKGVGAFFWKLLVALVYGCAGIYMVTHPLRGVLSLTLILAIFLLFEAIAEIALYFRVRRVRNAGWVLFDGIVTLILGLLIWIHWPSSSIWVIGTFMGISLIFSGLSRIMLAMATRDRA
jgi:uncharacterized membrane protein HdeD (DUF308 family)